MTVFEDIFDLIELKVHSIEILASTLEAHKVLREELAGTTDITRIKEIVDLIAKENEKHHGMLPFKDPLTGKTKWDMWQVSTFHDEYVKTKHGYMRYWFVCMAGGIDYPCMTAILSKKWKRKFEDPSPPRAFRMFPLWEHCLLWFLRISSSGCRSIALHSVLRVSMSRSDSHKLSRLCRI
jgi:hypothetical protein